MVDRGLSVVYVFTDDGSDELCSRLLLHLQPDEQARAARFLYAKDRLLFAAGRALVRKRLSLYGAEPPGGWRFTSTAEGKPRLEPRIGPPHLQFNISHCVGVVIAAFAHAREVGVDVEPALDSPDYLELSQSYFAPSEIRLLDRLDEVERREAFLSIWTLKEAYTKARGRGLSIPLRDFAFSLNPPAIEFSPQHPGQAEEWFFYSDRLSSGHRFALAAERRTGEQLTCQIEQLQLRELLTP